MQTVAWNSNEIDLYKIIQCGLCTAHKSCIKNKKLVHNAE